DTRPRLRCRRRGAGSKPLRHGTRFTRPGPGAVHHRGWQGGVPALVGVCEARLSEREGFGAVALDPSLDYLAQDKSVITTRQCRDDATFHPAERVGQDRDTGGRRGLRLDPLELLRGGGRWSPQLLGDLSLTLVQYTDGEMVRVADHADRLGGVL